MEFTPIAAERLAAITVPCLPYLDMLVINDAEAGATAGITTVQDGRADAAACEQAAKAIMERSTADLVIVHFPMGAVAATRAGEVLRKPSVRVPQEAIRSSNGAGDAFASGILLGVHEGWPLADSLALANAAAAASLRSLTTTGSVEGWRECLALAEKWGWRDSLTG